MDIFKSLLISKLFEVYKKAISQGDKCNAFSLLLMIFNYSFYSLFGLLFITTGDFTCSQ